MITIDRELLTIRKYELFILPRIDDKLLASSTFFVLAFAYWLHNSTIRDNSLNREVVIGITEWSARNVILHGK